MTALFCIAVLICALATISALVVVDTYIDHFNLAKLLSETSTEFNAIYALCEAISTVMICLGVALLALTVAILTDPRRGYLHHNRDR